MTALTARQAQILTLIRQFMAEAGRPPTRAEIAKAVGFRSANAAEEHLRALQRKGVIDLIPGAARGIRLISATVPEVSEDVPAGFGAGLAVIGRVAAGNPILAQEHIERYYLIDPRVFHPMAHYLLRVQGMSMRDAGILEGDLLAVHRVPQASNGQIVVARVADEVTVKRFQRRGSQVQLLPENSQFTPIEIDLRHQPLTIEGIGVGILRPGIAP